MPRLSTVCLYAVLFACGINPAYDDTLATTSTSSSTASTTSEPASTTSPLDPTTSTSTDTGGSATEALTGGSTATSDDTTGGDTTGEPPPPPPDPEHLQHYDPANCNEPLWCFAKDEGVFAGQPARIHSQACFNPSARPFRLVHLDYIIAAVFGDIMGDAFLEIRAYDPMAPGPPLVPPIPLVNADLLVGNREYTFDPPIELDVDAFCVGFSAGHVEPDEASLGVAIDPMNLPEDQSYVRSEGPMGCNTLIWLDIHDIDPTPKGGWCIAADVESVP